MSTEPRLTMNLRDTATGDTIEKTGDAGVFCVCEVDEKGELWTVGIKGVDDEMIGRCIVSILEGAINSNGNNEILGVVLMAVMERFGQSISGEGGTTVMALETDGRDPIKQKLSETSRFIN